MLELTADTLEKGINNTHGLWEPGACIMVEYFPDKLVPVTLTTTNRR